jgi:hypothetical protein
MQVDQSPFLVNKLDMENLVVLIRLEQADTTKGKNVVIGDPRLENDAGLTPSRKVVMEKLPDGEETITITIRGSTTGSHERKAKGSTSAHDDGKRKPTAANLEQASRPPLARSGCHGGPPQVTQCHGQTTTKDGHTAPRAGQTAPHQNRAPRMIKPQSIEAGKWKVNEGRNTNLTFKPTFDYLLNKYTKASLKDRAMKRPRSLIRQGCRERLKQMKPEANGMRIVEGGYDPRIAQPSHFTHPFGHPGASSSTGFPTNQMQWSSPSMMPTYLI